MSLTPEREQQIRDYVDAPGQSNWRTYEALIHELLKGIGDLRAERTWQPMASAPKDGTRVLALYKDGHISFMWWCGGRWCINGKHRTPTFFAAPPNGHGQPIGWMPLPAPPTTEEGK